MIYVGIPAHDERHTVGPLLWRIRQLLSDRGRDFRILVLDDGSTDGTSGVLEAYRRVLPLTLLRHEERRGYAASLERIIRKVAGQSGYPKRDALVVLQADFTDAPKAIPHMVRRFESGMDLVLSAPSVREEHQRGEEFEVGREREPRPEPTSVRCVRIGARFVAPGLAALPGVSNPFGSLRLFRLFTLVRALEVAEEKGETLLSHEGWAANLELLLAVWPHVRRVAEVASPPDYGRRYRHSRFRMLAELRSLRRASRDPRLRSSPARVGPQV